MVKIDGITYKLSDKPLKKLMAIIDNEKIYFGDIHYEHYYDRTKLLPLELNHRDKRRRENYLKRATKITDKNGNLTVNNIMSPNYHAVRVLW